MGSEFESELVLIPCFALFFARGGFTKMEKKLGCRDNNTYVIHVLTEIDSKFQYCRVDCEIIVRVGDVYVHSFGAFFPHSGSIYLVVSRGSLNNN